MKTYLKDHSRVLKLRLALQLCLLQPKKVGITKEMLATHGEGLDQESWPTYCQTGKVIEVPAIGTALGKIYDLCSQCFSWDLNPFSHLRKFFPGFEFDAVWLEDRVQDEDEDEEFPGWWKRAVRKGPNFILPGIMSGGIHSIVIRAPREVKAKFWARSKLEEEAAREVCVQKFDEEYLRLCGYQKVLF